jgi:hypothetical protein
MRIISAFFIFLIVESFVLFFFHSSNNTHIAVSSGVNGLDVVVDFLEEEDEDEDFLLWLLVGLPF